MNQDCVALIVQKFLALVVVVARLFFCFIAQFSLCRWTLVFFFVFFFYCATVAVSVNLTAF
jgi:hypothetical protein